MKAHVNLREQYTQRETQTLLRLTKPLGSVSPTLNKHQCGFFTVLKNQNTERAVERANVFYDYPRRLECVAINGDVRTKAAHSSQLF